MTASIESVTLPAVPDELAQRGIRLQPQDEASRSFQLHLFVQTRWDELAASGWPDEQKQQFLAQQFTFQDFHYSRY